MRGVVLSAVGRTFPYSLSLGLCLASVGCDSKPAAENAEPATTTVAAAPASVAPTAPALLPPPDRYAAGDRYASAPRVDPAVQPVGYAEPPRMPSTTPGAQPLPATNYGAPNNTTPSAANPTTAAPRNFVSPAYGSNPSLSSSSGPVRHDPLPHSP